MKDLLILKELLKNEGVLFKTIHKLACIKLTKISSFHKFCDDDDDNNNKFSAFILRSVSNPYSEGHLMQRIH